MVSPARITFPAQTWLELQYPDPTTSVEKVVDICSISITCKQIVQFLRAKNLLPITQTLEVLQQGHPEYLDDIGKGIHCYLALLTYKV